MKKVNVSHTKTSQPIHVLLAEDDYDDRFFFNKTLKDIPVPTHLTIVENGEKLMAFLLKSSEKLPDILFLDLNMPRKNGSECLTEIKNNPELKHLAVIIYSTSMHENIAEVLWEKGAWHYFRKGSITDLKRMLHYVLTLLEENKFIRPDKNKFMLTLEDTHI